MKFEGNAQCIVYLEAGPEYLKTSDLKVSASARTAHLVAKGDKLSASTIPVSCAASLKSHVHTCIGNITRKSYECCRAADENDLAEVRASSWMCSCIKPVVVFSPYFKHYLC